MNAKGNGIANIGILKGYAGLDRFAEANVAWDKQVDPIHRVLVRLRLRN